MLLLDAQCYDESSHQKISSLYIIRTEKSNISKDKLTYERILD